MNKTDINALSNGFANPGSEFRGAPFWAWNGKLDPAELRRQIRQMKEMGLGGFFMHARVGLGTAYLSDDWFDCVKACIDEAEKLDMQAWLYDEDRWPSGAAGGLVTCDPRFRMRNLRVRELKASEMAKADQGHKIIAIYAGKVNDVKVASLRKLDKLTSPLRAGETGLVFDVVVHNTDTWYNGQTYLDTMNHEAVKKFIEVTHETYRKEICKEFGKRVPGIFTDEPNYGRVCCKHEENSWVTAWTDVVPEVFQKRYGYDLIDHLVELFYDVEGVSFSRARLNYIDCLTYLFVDAFSRQIGEWCAKNNMQFTGHVLEEDTLTSQTNCVGSAMRFYEYMQAPGIDLLTEHCRVYDTAKQMTSAARQFDCRWRITETYGCTGWDFPFAGHKALGDWQAAMGINVRCQHLAWYTMAAEAKRDYPAAIFYQSPWYRDYRHVEDYFARINYMMDHGKEVRDLLVVHPIESAWTMIRKGWREDEKTNAYERKLITLRDFLLGAKLDFDYGDEELMSRLARITKVNGVTTLYVGKAAYRVVIVPEMVTVRASTLKLLKDFAAQGGKVIGLGSPAAYVDGLASDAAVKAAAGWIALRKEGKELVAAVESTARRVQVADANGKAITSALYLMREDEQNDYLFICNTGHTAAQLKEKGRSTIDISMARDRKYACNEVTVTLATNKKGQVCEFDPETGKIYQADAKKTAAGWQISTSLPVLGSRLFVVLATGTAKYPRRAKLETVAQKKLNPANWALRRNEDNVIVFDHFSAAVDNGKAGGREYFFNLDDRLRKLIGCDVRGGHMVQPWVKQRDTGKTIKLKFTAEFECDVLPSGALYLAVEFPELYQVSVNGHALDIDAECGWWCDRSLRKLPVEPAMLQYGKNVITFETDYNGRHPGLEMIYLLGDFGTKLKQVTPVMTATPSQLKLGDWCKQGLTFYSGSATYTTTVKAAAKKGERLFLTLPEYRGVCVRILIDGKATGLIAWPPQELDITEFVKGDKFELGIEVISHRRNSHGPFHCKAKWPHWTGPGQFKEYDFPGFQLVPCGLLQAPVLEVRQAVKG